MSYSMQLALGFVLFGVLNLLFGGCIYYYADSQGESKLKTKGSSIVHFGVVTLFVSVLMFFPALMFPK